MRQPRERQFDPSNPPWLHCISRCVRGAFLCGEGLEHRKEWIERRLGLLARYCSVQVGAYAIMSNHLHVVLRPRPQAVSEISDQQVLYAWWALKENEDLLADPQRLADPTVQAVLQAKSEEAGFIMRWRERLGSLSWFMKSLKEPLSRWVNNEEQNSGAFWEGRFRSIPLLDTAAIASCMAYVDLNPIRAQLADRPETSAFTSIKARIEAYSGAQAEAPVCSPNANQDQAQSTASGKMPFFAESPSVEVAPTDGHPWLTPIHQIIKQHECDPGLSEGDYIVLVDTIGRQGRLDKRGRIPAELVDILRRIDPDLPATAFIDSMLTPKSLLGAALGKVQSLANEAARRGLHWLQKRCPLLN